MSAQPWWGEPELEPAVDAAAVGLQGRAERAARRRRGAVPTDLRARLQTHTKDMTLARMAGMLSNDLGGLRPSALDEQEVEQLKAKWVEPGDDDAWVSSALLALEAVGYGAPRGRQERRLRAHGLRREQRLRGVLGKLPRAWALRAPFTADTHRSGRMDGRDPYGPVRCSHTLRSTHHALVAAAGGLWHTRSRDAQPFFECTASELATLANGRPRQGGKEIAEVLRALGELVSLEISATVEHRGEGTPSAAHVLPGTPLVGVERRLPGSERWVAIEDYAAAIDSDDVAAARAAIEADGGIRPTLRIHLAPWFIEELVGRHGRGPVYVNFDVWAHLRPTDRRVYAWVQGRNRSHRDSRKVDFYLSPPLRFTLGLTGQAQHEAADAVRHALTALYHADERYRLGFAEYTHPNGRPAFELRPGQGEASRPTAEALVSKVMPRRPAVVRGAHSRIRRGALLAGRLVRVDQLDPQHRREVGDEQALREAQEVRRAVLESFQQRNRAVRALGEPGDRERAARRASARAWAGAREGPAPP